MNKNKYLLLEDVDGLGNKGEIVLAKAGFGRNFLIPQRKAVIAQKHLVKMQERLKEERKVQSEADRKEAVALAKDLASKTLKVEVKIDTAGHMYGSISAVDVGRMMKDQLGIELTKRQILLARPIRKMGVHEIDLKLKERVDAKVTLEIKAEAGAVLQSEPQKEEVPADEATLEEAKTQVAESGEES